MPIYLSPIEDVYVYFDDGIIRKFSDPYVYGGELSTVMKNAAKGVINHLNLDKSEDILVIKILEGGKFYYMSETLREVGFRNIDEAVIDIKSRMRYDPKDVVTEVVDYGNIFEKLVNASIVVLGETIASGSTMETFINTISDYIRGIKEFIIIGFHTCVGVDRVIRKLSEFNVKYKFYSYGGLLGLGPNKTDMTVNYSPSYIPDIVRERVYKALGKYIADRLCVIGDFTYSFKYIDFYLAERIIQLRELFDDAGSDDRIKIVSLIREGLSRMMNLGLSINEINERLNEEYRRRMKLIGVDVDTTISIEYVLNDDMLRGRGRND